jgi:hypothetical protein
MTCYVFISNCVTPTFIEHPHSCCHALAQILLTVAKPRSNNRHIHTFSRGGEPTPPQTSKSLTADEIIRRCTQTYATAHSFTGRAVVASTTAAPGSGNLKALQETVRRPQETG